MPKNPYALFVFYICLHLFLAIAVNKARQDEVTKRWARFFSGGLVILAAQYALMGYSYEPGKDAFGRLIILLSVLNNPFFLAGALILLDRTNQRHGWRHLLSGRLFLAASAASLCIAAGILLSGSTLPRALVLSAAVVSVVVYVVEAYAYFTVLNFFRYHVLRFLPIGTAIFFSTYEALVALKVQWELPDYVSILFRFLFFIPPVLMLTLRMPQDLELKEIFEKATRKREFILSEKLVESIGTLIKAQKVMFLIERPDFHLGASAMPVGRFDGYAWERGRTNDEGGYSLQAALEDTTEEERRLLREVCPPDCAEEPPQYFYQYCRSAGGFETIILPIEVYGGVIGALFIRLQRSVRARAIFIEKLKLSILTLLPLAQGSRQMAAIARLNEGFTGKLFLDRLAIGRKSEDGELEALEGVDEILGSIIETLSPLAVALKPPAHLKPGGRVLLLPDQKYFPNERREEFVAKYFGAKPDDKPLGGVSPIHIKTDFGRLIMFVGEGGDYPDRPTMGTHPVVLDVLRAMTNNALKSLLDHNLRRMLEAADQELSEGMTKTSDAHQIVHVLQKYARRFGIDWIVLVLEGNRFHGQEEKFEPVRRRLRACVPDKKIKVEEPAAGEKWAGHLVSCGWPLESSAKSNGHGSSQISFWFGVESPEFRRDETWDNIFLQFIRLGVSKIKDLRMRELLEQWDVEQEVRLRELARFCRYVGNETRLITFGVREEAGVSDRSVHFHRLKLLADELNEASDLLSQLGQERMPPYERLVLKDVIQEAWDGLNSAGHKRGHTLLFEGDCLTRVVAAKDDLLFLFSRLMHWLVTSAAEGSTPARLTARCRLDGLQVEISFESSGFRIHRVRRESMFVPMTQRINYDELLEGGGPKLFLAMCLVKTIIEKRYEGSLADRSDELPGEAGNKLVVTLPILN
ncbi:MAG TPA: hypothetical protein VF656_07095 [Pyrinomonadaceae bacterium]|jgi:hypothetical protein